MRWTSGKERGVSLVVEAAKEEGKVNDMWKYMGVGGGE